MYVCIYMTSLFTFSFSCVVYMYVHMLVCMHGTHVACVSVCMSMHAHMHTQVHMHGEARDDKIVLIVLHLTF